MGTLRIEGKVFSGKGEGAKFIKLPWVKKQIEEKLGFTPFLGTLNLRLCENGVKLKEQLKNEDSMEILPAEGFRRGKCFKAYLMDSLECAIVFPEVADYPADVIEIVAPVNLREKLQLKDGDVVEVKIQF
jgi:riboflavin kinase, archaea type